MTETDMIDFLQEKAEQIPECNNITDEYLDEAGFRCCKVCGKRRENEYSMIGKTFRVRCLCECEQAEQKKIQEEQRKKEFALHGLLSSIVRSISVTRD